MPSPTISTTFATRPWTKLAQIAGENHEVDIVAFERRSDGGTDIACGAERRLAQMDSRHLLSPSENEGWCVAGVAYDDASPRHKITSPYGAHDSAHAAAAM
jgi:hypothetical protein